MAVDDLSKSNLLAIKIIGGNEKDHCARRDVESASRQPKVFDLRNAGCVAVLALLYMALSSGLITFNKYLMHESRFPYAICIGLAQMSGSTAFNLLLYRLRPALFPSLTDPERRIAMDRGFALKILLPIAACFTASLVLSNMAFIHSSVAFLQMMKQSNVVLVYLFSLAVGLERYSHRQVAVLVFIVCATSLTVRGEHRFSGAGFALQAASMVFESMKLTLQNYSLSAVGKKLDALTYVLLIAPLAAGLIVAIPGALSLLRPTPVWSHVPESLLLPPWHLVLEYRWLLAANGCLAFALNVSHAFFIQRSSAITFILSGITLKDILIVGTGAVILGELLNPLQMAGFALQVVGILCWGLLKVGPDMLRTCRRPEQVDHSDESDVTGDTRPPSLSDTSSSGEDNDSDSSENFAI